MLFVGAVGEVAAAGLAVLPLVDEEEVVAHCAEAIGVGQVGFFTTADTVEDDEVGLGGSSGRNEVGVEFDGGRDPQAQVLVGQAVVFGGLGTYAVTSADNDEGKFLAQVIVQPETRGNQQSQRYRKQYIRPGNVRKD